MTTTTVRKWGNSYAVRLPHETVRKLGLLEGQEMSVQESDGSLSLVPLSQSAKSLARLIAAITPRNKHASLEWGGPVGKEAW